MGRLVKVYVKRSHGGPMDSKATATLEPGRGILGNADRGGRRQVTLLSEERWAELMRQVGASLETDARRANLVLSGISLENTRGRVLIVGPCRLRISGETRPCEQMEEAARGLQAAMRENWGGGAFAEVIEGGAVTVGDMVTWDNEESSSV
jgi:MOSC domain-containing protein YiiM